MVYEPLYHALQTDGNCTRPLKIKNKLKIGCFYKQSWEEFSIFCGRFDETIIPLALVGCEMIIANSALHASLDIHHLMIQRALVEYLLIFVLWYS